MSKKHVLGLSGILKFILRQQIHKYQKKYCAAHEVRCQTSQKSNVKKARQMRNVKHQMSNAKQKNVNVVKYKMPSVKDVKCQMPTAKCQKM